MDNTKCGCGGTYITQQNSKLGMVKCNGRCKSTLMKCTCGKWIYKGSGYFQSDYRCSSCENEFNSNGNKLTPRKEWGEETGEIFA